MDQFFEDIATNTAFVIYCVAVVVSLYCIGFHGFEWLRLSYGFAGQSAGFATIPIELQAIDRHFNRMMMGIYAILLCMIYFAIASKNRD